MSRVDPPFKRAPHVRLCVGCGEICKKQIDPFGVVICRDCNLKFMAEMMATPNNGLPDIDAYIDKCHKRLLEMNEASEWGRQISPSEIGCTLEFVVK